MPENLMQSAQPNSAEQSQTPPPAAGAPPVADPLASVTPPTAGTPPEPGKTPEGEKPAAAQPEGAPEKYEFKAADGKEFDAEFLKGYETVAKELDLPQAKAQALLDKVGPVIEARQAARMDALRTEWTESSKADKEFGGEKLIENLGVAKAALDRFGTPELKELINVSGIGNHPEMIRFFYRAGKAISADTFVGRGSQSGQGNQQHSFNDHAQKIYGK